METSKSNKNPFLLNYLQNLQTIPINNFFPVGRKIEAEAFPN